MANMFKDREKITIPRSLNECTKQDRLTENLWTWARRLETWGKILAVASLIVGLIVAINAVDSDAFKELENETPYRYDAAFREAVSNVKTQTFFDKFEPFLAWAFIFFFVWHAIALIIGALASIVQNTRISANAALLSARNSAYQSNTINSSEADNSDGEQTESSDSSAEITAFTVSFPERYTIIRHWDNKLHDNNVEKTCAFCRCKKNCSFMLTKNNEGNKELLWLCDECIEKYSKTE